MSVNKVSVTLKTGQKGSGKTISAAIRNALTKRKPKPTFPGTGGR